jgi:hypothetical protein
MADCKPFAENFDRFRACSVDALFQSAIQQAITALQIPCEQISAQSSSQGSLHIEIEHILFYFSQFLMS